MFILLDPWDTLKKSHYPSGMWGLIVFQASQLLQLRHHAWNESFWDPGAPMVLLTTHRAEMTHDCWVLLKFLTQRLPSNEIIFALNHLPWDALLQGNPLQYSCLVNPRDGGAWWAAVTGVAQSWTRLKRLSSSSSSSSRHQRQKHHRTPKSEREPTGGHWGGFTEEAEFELDLTGMSGSSGRFFYSPAQEHVSYLRSKTQQNSHLSKYKTKVQRTRNFAFEMRKNASLLLPSERDQWGVNNIISYMCSFSRLPLHWGLYFSSKIPLSFTRLPYLQP